MRIALLSNMTPSSENFRGTSALPFHLLIERPEDVNVDVYSFDYNQLPLEKVKESEARLGVKIYFLPRPRIIDWMINHEGGLLCRLFMQYPIHNYVKLTDGQLSDIKSKGYDGIWIYGEEMSRVSRQFSEYKRCHLLPDCTSLFFYRMMSRRFVFNSFSYLLKNFIFYRKYLRMEKGFDTMRNIYYLLVGEADAASLRNINPGVQAHFIRHPHYDVAFNSYSKKEGLPIKLLIAGRNDYYMQQDAELAIDALCAHSDLADSYSITFLGKGWEDLVLKLKNAGFDVSHITFVPDYVDEISKYDIQLTPICIGTGTKGKVLDALSNGLLVIGSWYSMENVAVKSGESCIVYESDAALIDCLKELAQDRQHLFRLAEEGRKSVLKEHGRKKVAEEFFSYLR